MSRKTKIAFLVVALVFAGSYAAYRTLFGSTTVAIRHAEAFLFRRMTVSQLAEQGHYRFFYSSNRRLDKPATPLQGNRQRERDPSLHFGRFDSEVQPTLGLGMLINPTEWFQNEEIQLKDVTPLRRDEFLRQLRQQVDNSPHQGLLVLVHGYREAFPTALRKTAFVSHVLDLDAPVLLFDWPGNQGGSLAGYRRARGVAEESGAELAALLEMLATEIEPDSLWLLANSLGGEVVVNAFESLDQSGVLTGAGIRLEDVVLTAPDIDRDKLDAGFRNEVEALADNLTVYVSSNDRALVVSRLVNRAPRAGESTLQPDQLDEAERVIALTRASDDLVTLVDVTPVNRTRNFHNFSLETPEFFDDLFLRLTNDETPRSRPIYKVVTPEGRAYWVLTRGR